jgi:hypothetical protein
MIPAYDLNKIKFSTDGATFQRGVDLYKKGKVTEVKEEFGNFSATVRGTKPYHVSLSARQYRNAVCTCYLGERGTLCKHVVAVALHAVLNGQPLKYEDTEQAQELKCSDKRELLTSNELASIKKSIADAMKYIKPYHGPSSTWFANQASLQEGCSRLRAIISDLPVNSQAANFLVKLLLRLERKASIGGVDDSNGTVGVLANEIAALLKEFVRIDPGCIKSFKPFCTKEDCFGWKASLIQIYHKKP